MVKNSLMLFSSHLLPKVVEADCGPHLLPKVVEADCGPHLLPKVVEAGYWVRLIPKVCRSWLLATPYPKSLSKLVIGHTCSTHAHLLPKVVEAGYWVHYTPIITRTPSSTPHSHAPYPIPHTPTIHPPYTSYTPTPYPSSCELTATK